MCSSAFLCATRDIPAALVTVWEGNKEKVMKTGARGYAVKPFKEDELKEGIKSMRG